MSGLVIRPLDTSGERAECVRLQEVTWGDGFVDRVPSSILMIARETGGVASGAFDGDRLVGFVFGVSGFRDGRRIHWSDMLAVLPDYRDRGLGYRLKIHQREVLLGHGIETVFWTFDPLVARNAHLNLRRLGAVVRSYKRDLYGRSDSPLHAGIGTDRLLAEWWIASDRVVDTLAGQRADLLAGRPPVINPPADAAHPLRPGDRIDVPGRESAAIAVPTDIQALKAKDPGAARAWRENVRAAFETSLESGYEAVDLQRGEPLAHYILQRR